MLTKRAYATRIHPGREKPFGEPHSAEGQGSHALDESILGQHKLERTTTDIHHQRTAGAQLEMRQGTAITEQRFFLAAQDAHTPAGERLHPAGKLGAVGGVTYGAGCHDLDSGGAQLAGQRHHSLYRGHSSIDGRRRQRTGRLQSLTESRHRFHLVDHADLPGGRHIRHDLSNGIGADVDRGDADIGRCRREWCRHVGSLEEDAGASSSNR